MLSFLSFWITPPDFIKFILNTMKKTVISVFILAICLITLNAGAQLKKSGLTITGTAPAALDGLTIYLDSSVTYLNMHSSQKLDSAIIKNGRFAFTRHMAEPAELTLSIHTKEYSGNRNFLSGNNEHIFVTLSPLAAQKNCFDKAILKGSKLTAEYDELEAYLQVRLSPADSIAVSQLRKKDHTPAEAAKAIEIISGMGPRRERQTMEFIDKHPDYYVSLLRFRELLGRRVTDIPGATARYNGLSPRLQQTPLGKRSIAFIRESAKLQIGEMAPNFTASTPDGKSFTLSDTRGKYILLDFWASWCGPCRAENPNVIKAYNRFKSEKFDIIGFSLDGPGAHNAWVKAITDDHLPWLQVSELKGWESNLVKKFLISSVPQNYLIDPTGKIIALNLRGEMLEKELEKILN
jgi:peroxiredoxin